MRVTNNQNEGQMLLSQMRRSVGYAVLAVAGIGIGCSDSATGPNATVAVTMPVTPDVPDLSSQVVAGAREFRVTASVFQQQLATFPFQKAEVWGFNRSTPGPTAIAYEGEKIRFIVTNNLPEPTTVHFHACTSRTSTTASPASAS